LADCKASIIFWADHKSSIILLADCKASIIFWADHKSSIIFLADCHQAKIFSPPYIDMASLLGTYNFFLSR
jgi:hypothetical protein